LNKSSLIGSSLCVLLAVSVISYARTFTQEPSSQGSQPQAQNPNKADRTELTSAKAQEQKPGEAVISVVAEAGSLAGSVTEAKGLSPSSGDSNKTVSLPGFTAETYMATAYNLRGRTASGRPVSRGLIAADPSVLPMGSRVRVEAGALSGEYLVADTGGGVKGRHIDIWTPTAGEAMRFGKRAVKLTVLSYGPKRIRSAAKRSARMRNLN